MARFTLATASAALATLLVMASSLPALAAEPAATEPAPPAPPTHQTTPDPAAPHDDADAGAPSFRLGASGPAVLQLQLALDGAGTTLPLTARFGKLTAQAEARVKMDPAAPLDAGDSGPAVSALQRALTSAGYPVEATGRFGPLTASLVRHFQLDRHEQPSGEITLDEVESATPLYTILGYLDGLVGSRYAWGGTEPATGFDCSGLVRYVYSRVGIALAHSSYALWDSGMPVAPGHLEPGDLVFFTTFRAGPSHVGVYIGGDEFIHAENPEFGVTVSSLDAAYWFRRYVGARRVL